MPKGIGYGIRQGVLGSDESGKIKGAKGPTDKKDVTLPPIKKAKVSPRDKKVPPVNVV